MGQWGRFSQIKHEGLSRACELYSLCFCQVFVGRKRGGGKSDLMLLNCLDYLVDTMKGNSLRHIVFL